MAKCMSGFQVKVFGRNVRAVEKHGRLFVNPYEVGMALGIPSSSMSVYIREFGPASGARVNMMLHVKRRGMPSVASFSGLVEVALEGLLKYIHSKGSTYYPVTKNDVAGVMAEVRNGWYGRSLGIKTTPIPLPGLTSVSKRAAA